jgi:hypothetical protein
MRCGKRRKRKLRKAVRVSEAKSNAEGKKALLCEGWVRDLRGDELSGRIFKRVC